MHRRTVRFVMLTLLVCAAGCTQAPVQPDRSETAGAVPEPDPPPPVEPERRRSPVPPPAVAEPPAPVDAEEPSLEPVAVVLSDRTPAFEDVANELVRLLDDYLLYNLADKSLAPPAVFAGVEELQAKVVIAIGLAATREAILRSPVPVVFCQVFNIAAAQDTAVPLRGVASTPPLAQQVAVWKQVNPELKAVGAILGPGHEALLAEARDATAAHGVAFHFRVANSDRETLFIFQRMAPEIDGFWLFPDNRVLSIEILQDLLDYAARHDVDVAVFNQSLLDMGATLSATTVAADVAATALSVAAQLVHGDVDDVPWMTPLHDVRVATRNGVPFARQSSPGGEP